MSKRSPNSIHIIDEWFKRGDGIGEGRDFRPFYKVRDVPSRGRSAIDVDIKTGIQQHTLSDIEYRYLLLAEYSLLVREIRCQLALTRLAETLQIASSLGIRHPYYPGRQIPRVVTSDIVLNMVPDDSITVISVKPEIELDPNSSANHRTLELLLIEKTYWQRRNAKWLIGTEKALPRNKLFNLEFFRPGVKSPELAHLHPRLTELTQELDSVWRDSRTLNQILRILSSRMTLPVDHVFKLIGRAVWTHAITIDLDTRKLHHEEPLPRPSFSHPPLRPP